MATMKRRVIYLPDDEWAAVLRMAAVNKVTASQLVRDCLQRGHLRVENEYVQDLKSRDILALDKQKRAFLRGVDSTSDRFNTRPFTPVPKK